MRENRQRITTGRALPFGLGVGSRVSAPGGTVTIIGVYGSSVEVRLDNGRVVDVDSSQVRYVR